jgi:protein phosphatase
MNDLSNNLIIEEKKIIKLDKFELEIDKYLGIFAPETHYFKVIIKTKPEKETFGLLRIGNIHGCLAHELKLRQTLPDYGMFSELLSAQNIASVTINTHYHKKQQQNQEQEIDIEDTEDTEILSLDHDYLDEYEYLEEEYYPEDDVIYDDDSEKLILLTYLPREKFTLEHWFIKKRTINQNLSLIISICQCFSYLYQHQWCFLDLLPQFIELGTPIKFYDLTTVYPVEERLNTGILGYYSAPELTVGNQIDQNMSTYTIGALLYQCLHHKIPEQSQLFDLKIDKISPFYQILKICLSPVVEDRFYLSQLLDLLINLRQEYKKPLINWQIASKSTIGLSLNRLHNEDSYGIRYEKNTNSDTMIFGIVADGMGGMAEGEIASKIAVDTVMSAPIPIDLKTAENKQNWLNYLVNQANQSITNQVKDGGTTLSIVWAISNQLLIAHVGDSRIYLLRNNVICQLSEDHSLVSMLLNGGDISYEQSLQHSQRNILTKSLGNKANLSPGYVQNLTYCYTNVTHKLEDKDILILCSDGVWDLVSAVELADLFIDNSMDLAVEKVIEQVLEKGANDNATIVALQCKIKYNN